MTAFRTKKPWEEKEPKRKALISSGERAGLALCTVMFIYSVSEGDVPLGFFAMSFILFIFHKILDQLGEHNPRLHFLAGVLQGLYIAFFVGSILLIFI